MENGEKCVMNFWRGKSRRAGRRIFVLKERVGARNNMIEKFFTFTQNCPLGLCKPC